MASKYTLKEYAFGVIVHEIVRALKRQNYRVIGLVNGHGLNITYAL